jgi:hypothetical protein
MSYIGSENHGEVFIQNETDCYCIKKIFWFQNKRLKINMKSIKKGELMLINALLNGWLVVVCG